MTTTMPATNDVNVCRAIVQSIADDHIVLSFAETSYEMRLIPTGPIDTPIGKRITGVIRVQARRIDIVQTGGRYVEPVYGRPCRIQGQIVATDLPGSTVTVAAPMPIVCKTDGRQRAGDFQIGDFVTMGTEPGATFTPASP